MKWPWPAREIETALQGYAQTGLPRLVILSLSKAADAAVLPAELQ